MSRKDVKEKQEKLRLQTIERGEEEGSIFGVRRDKGNKKTKTITGIKRFGRRRGSNGDIRYLGEEGQRS